MKAPQMANTEAICSERDGQLSSAKGLPGLLCAGTLSRIMMGSKNNIAGDSI